MIGISELPAEWESCRLKYLATYNDEVLSENTDDLTEINYVEISGVSLSGGIENVSTMSFYEAPSRARRKVKKGDVLVSTVRTYLKAIATVNEASDNLIASTGFCVIRPKANMCPNFIGWVLKSEPFVGEVVARSVGVSYPAINSTELVTINIPLPPLETQRRIAQFLDEKTARIDGLIEKKKALLEKLAEKRQALITRAVTKGLNPDAPTKLSGIDWLGDIPAHWEVMRLKHFSEIKTGFAFKSDLFLDEGIPVLRIGEILFDGTIDLNNAKCLPNNYIDIYKDWIIKEGDFVMAMTGATVGKPGKMVGVETALLNQRVCKITAKNPDKIDFLWLILNSDYFRKYIELEAYGGAQPNISADVIGLCPVGNMSNLEARLISKEIMPKISEIEKTRGLISHTISKLEEYRSALITSAVTGKLEVP